MPPTQSPCAPGWSTGGGGPVGDGVGVGAGEPMAGGPGGPRKMPESMAFAPAVREATIDTDPPAATLTV